MAMRRLVLLAALVLSAAAATRADEVDDYMTRQMKAYKLPGVALAIVKDGKIVKAAGYGLANRERNVAVTPDTVFKIGSVSKQFIATGIMLLANDGRLGVDDPVSKYLQGTPESWTPITIRHLLTTPPAWCASRRHSTPTRTSPTPTSCAPFTAWGCDSAGIEVRVFQHRLLGARRDHPRRDQPAVGRIHHRADLHSGRHARDRTDKCHTDAPPIAPSATPATTT